MQIQGRIIKFVYEIGCYNFFLDTPQGTYRLSTNLVIESEIDLLYERIATTPIFAKGWLVPCVYYLTDGTPIYSVRLNSLVVITTEEIEVALRDIQNERLNQSQQKYNLPINTSDFC